MLTAETAERVQELVDATGRSAEDILAGAVMLYAITVRLNWSSGMAALAVEKEES